MYKLNDSLVNFSEEWDHAGRIDSSHPSPERIILPG